MELRTPRLRLREFVADDADRVFAWQSDPAYLAHYDGAPPTREDVLALVTTFRRWAEEAPRRRWQLAIERDGALVGTVGVRVTSPGVAEYGCELDPRVWGAGLAREASEALLAFASRSLGVERFVAFTLPENRGAARLAEALGFREVAPGRFEREG